MWFCNGLYMGVTKFETTNKEGGDTIPGVYISNTAWTAEAIKNGSGMGDAPFAFGDSLILEVIGLVDDNATNKLYIPLADYRSNDMTMHYYLTTWQWFDLSSFGKVEEVQFNMYTSQNNAYGALTPTFFALDNLGATRPEREVIAPLLDGETSVDLSLLTAFSVVDGTISYELIEKSENISTLQIADGIVHVDMISDEGSALVLVTQKGKKDYLRIVFEKSTTSTGHELVGNVAINVWTNNRDIIVSCEDEAYDMDIFSVSGRKLFLKTGNIGTTSIAMPRGEKVVIVRVVSESTLANYKLIINE